MIIGGLINYLFAGNVAKITQLRWEILPRDLRPPSPVLRLDHAQALIPISEARAAGLTMGQMVGALFAPI